MSENENNISSDLNAGELKEPSVSYFSKKEIHIFNSFEEQNDFHLQKMALQSHEECLQKLDELRRIFYKEYLLPDGSWPPIAKVITVKKPFK